MGGGEKGEGRGERNGREGERERRQEEGERGGGRGGEGRGMTCVMNSAAGVTLAVWGIIQYPGTISNLLGPLCQSIPERQSYTGSPRIMQGLPNSLCQNSGVAPPVPGTT